MRLWTFQSKDCVDKLLSESVYRSRDFYGSRVKEIDMEYVRQSRDDGMPYLPVYCFSRVQGYKALSLQALMWGYVTLSSYYKLNLGPGGRVMIELEVPESYALNTKLADIPYEAEYVCVKENQLKYVRDTEDTVETLLSEIRMDWVVAIREFRFTDNDRVICETVYSNVSLHPAWLDTVYFDSGYPYEIVDGKLKAVHGTNLENYLRTKGMKGVPAYYTVSEALYSCDKATCEEVLSKAKAKHIDEDEYDITTIFDIMNEEVGSMSSKTNTCAEMQFIDGYTPERCWYHNGYVTASMMRKVLDVFIGSDVLSEEDVVEIIDYLGLYDDSLSLDQIIAVMDAKVDRISDIWKNAGGMGLKREDERFIMHMIGWREYCFALGVLSVAGQVEIRKKDENHSNRRSYYIVRVDSAETSGAAAEAVLDKRLADRVSEFTKADAQKIIDHYRDIIPNGVMPEVDKLRYAICTLPNWNNVNPGALYEMLLRQETDKVYVEAARSKLVNARFGQCFLDALCTYAREYLVAPNSIKDNIEFLQRSMLFRVLRGRFVSKSAEIDALIGYGVQYMESFGWRLDIFKNGTHSIVNLNKDPKWDTQSIIYSENSCTPWYVIARLLDEHRLYTDSIYRRVLGMCPGYLESTPAVNKAFTQALKFIKAKSVDMLSCKVRAVVNDYIDSKWMMAEQTKDSVAEALSLNALLSPAHLKAEVDEIVASTMR